MELCKCGTDKRDVQNTPNLESVLFVLQHKVSTEQLPVADFFLITLICTGIKVTIC